MLKLEMQSREMGIACHKRLFMRQGVFATDRCREAARRLDAIQCAGLECHCRALHEAEQGRGNL